MAGWAANNSPDRLTTPLIRREKEFEPASWDEAMEYRAKDPMGKARIKAADYIPPAEEPDDDYPFFLTTGRVVYHWHTRTKTGRVKPLNDAAPVVFVEISREDANEYDIQDGDMVEVSTRRGKVEAPARVGNIIQGHLFIPFHYGYWDNPERKRGQRIDHYRL